MSEPQWTAIDAYLTSYLVPPDPALDAALETSAREGLPPIAVAPNQGKLLQLFVEMIGARRVLEVGTLGGYSTLWLARGLVNAGAGGEAGGRGGQIVTLELNPKHAAVARQNVDRAGVGSAVDIRVGKALDSLATLVEEKRPPFDFVFIDADKASIPAYFDFALRLTHPGSVIVVDNVVRQGKVIDPNSADPDVRGVRRLNEILAQEPRVRATAVQTVGSKGHDGFTLIRVVH